MVRIGNQESGIDFEWMLDSYYNKYLYLYKYLYTFGIDIDNRYLIIETRYIDITQIYLSSWLLIN